VRAPRVAVVVLTRDGGDHLAPGIDALFDAEPPRGGAEIILVDNASTDGAVERVAHRHPPLKVRRSERNLGFAGGVRFGVETTAAGILVLVNDDAVVGRDALAALVDALETAPPETVAAAGMLTDPAGERVDFVEGVVTFDGHALQRGFGRPLAEVDAGKTGDPRLFPCGGFCAVKRRDFESLGGFDADFFAYLEDVDFGWRASLAGRPSIFVPEARARHLSGATGKRLGLTMRGVLFESNAFTTAWKNLGDASLSALMPAILATFLHRTFRGVVEHQEGAGEALGDPFSDQPPRFAKKKPAPEPAPPSRRQRAVRRLARLAGISPPRALQRAAGPGSPFVIEDEFARMWLVAWNRIVSAWPSLAAKRQIVQALRRVSDEELFARWPLHLVPTYAGDEELFASDFFRRLLPEKPRLVETTLQKVAQG
jgi:GT2 family glycosyltransferase